MTSEVDGRRLASWTMAPLFKILEASLAERKRRAALGAGGVHEGAAPAVEVVAVVVEGAVKGVGLETVAGEAHAEAVRVVVTVDAAEAVLEIVVAEADQVVAKAVLEIVVAARRVGHAHAHVHVHVRAIGLGQQNLADSAVGLEQRLLRCPSVGMLPSLHHPARPAVDSRRCLRLLHRLLQYQTHLMLLLTVDLQPLLLLLT